MEVKQELPSDSTARQHDQKLRKLKWFGHVSWSSGLEKTILLGTVKGKRRDRQKKKLEDNFKEWRGMDFAMTRWKGIVANSSVVPDHLPRL